jgi:uncharacterized protein with NRDE domain
MCLIAFAYQASKRYPLIIAANRDEYLDRPTAPLALWQSPQGTTIASGRDLRDGGTWMGFTPAGRFAMLTNVRNPAAAMPNNPISRGQLALSWLESISSAQLWVQQLDLQRYNGFNLIIGDWEMQQCFYLSNQVPSEALWKQVWEQNRPLVGKKSSDLAIETIAIELQAGQVYALSNAALQTPWPKAVKLQHAVEQALSLQENISAHLLAALTDDQPAADAQLPSTGVPLVLERALSSPFVRYPAKQPHYGTRSSLVTLLDMQGQLRLEEVTYLSHEAEPSRAHATAQLQWA